MVMALVVAIGADPNSQRNLEFGLETGTWGFPRLRPWYGEMETDARVLLGTAYQHPSGNRSPRKQADEYRRGAMGSVVVAQASGAMRVATSPHWPDEVAEGRIKYPERFPLVPLFAIEGLALAEVPAEVAEGFRLSAINQGEGRLVEIPDAVLARLGDLAGVSSPDAATEFSESPGVSAGAVAAPVRNRRGAGRSNDPAATAAVEKWAEDLAAQLYVQEGWSVEREGKPFDLRCTRGSEERHVEVKGTTGEGASVFLTRNEVLHAAQFPTDLVVVTGVALDRRAEPVSASGGSLHRFADWVPAQVDLRPTQYEYRIPWSDIDR
jgi:hypothetical protein